MGTHFENPKDRRVVRTRRTLRDALIALIHERGWDAISVNDICARADVGRSTFYTHFADKEELLVAGFDELREALRAAVKMEAKMEAKAGSQGRAGAARSLAFVGPMLEHVRDNRRLFRALVGRKAAQEVTRRFRDVVRALVGEELAARCPEGPARDLAVQLLSGGFVEVVAGWLDARRPLPPDEIAQLYLRMAAPVIQVARGRP